VFGRIIFAVDISGLSHFLSDKIPLPYGGSVAIVLLLLLGIIGGHLFAGPHSQRTGQSVS